MTTDLARELASSDPEKRRVAAGQLGQVGAERVDLLMTALGDDDWRVREEAGAVARRLAPEPAVLAALVDCLRGGQNVGLRNAAVDALGAYGDAAVEALGPVIFELDADGRKLAVEALSGTRQPTALFVLRGLLDDEDANVRAAAVEAVTQLGAVASDDVVAILQSRLDEPDAFLRLVVLNGLNQLGAKVPWARVEPFLSEPVLRRAALEAAGRCGAPEAAPQLVSALETARGAELSSVLFALASLQEAGEAARSRLQEALALASPDARGRVLEIAARDSDDLVLRRCAVALLGPLGGEEAATIAVLALEDERVLEEAEAAVLELGPASVRALFGVIDSCEGFERAAAIELLGRVVLALDADARRHAADEIRARIDDPSPEVVRAALEVLADIGEPPHLVPVASLLSRDTSSSIARGAEAALRELARRWPGEARQLLDSGTLADHPSVVLAGALLALPDAAEVEAREGYLALVMGALSHQRSGVRRASLEALGMTGDARHIDEVAFALTDEEPGVRLAAVQALGALRSESGEAVGLGHLLALLERGRDPELLAAAAVALGDAGDASTLEALAPLVASPDARVAVAATEAVGRIDAPGRLSALRPGLSHSSGEVVKATLRAIGVTRSPEVLQAVGGCLDHRAWDVRRMAADVIGRLGGEAEVRLLRAKLASEAEPLVRDALQRALEELGALRRTPIPPKHGSYRPR